MARRWLLRIAAIAFGLAPFILFEFALFVLNLPKTSPRYDPFLDLSQTKPLFSESADGSLQIPEERQRLFAKVAFSRQKPLNTKRIFALAALRLKVNPTDHRPLSLSGFVSTFSSSTLRIRTKSLIAAVSRTQVIGSCQFLEKFSNTTRLHSHLYGSK